MTRQINESRTSKLVPYGYTKIQFLFSQKESSTSTKKLEINNNFKVRYLSDSANSLEESTAQQNSSAETTTTSHVSSVKDKNIETISSSLDNASYNPIIIAPNNEEEAFQKKLVFLMEGENYVSGEISASEEFVENAMDKFGNLTVMNWIMSFYEQNFSKPAVLIGLLHMISHFKYEAVKPAGPIMALGLLSHKSFSVREFAIKSFENWNDKASLNYLKNLHYENVALQKYVNEVIYDIEYE